MGGKAHIYRIRGLLFSIAAFVSLLLGGAFFAPSFAQEAARGVIRVGRFPYEEQLQADESGNYSGYGFDYLQELSHYTGWQYEFVDAPWSECLSMLERGELDLLGAVMQSPEREAVFAFADYPMVSGYGVLATTLPNDALPYEDFSGFNGLRVGVLEGNLHRENFLEYSRRQGFSTHLRSYPDNDAMQRALDTGELDAVIMTNLLRSPALRIVATFGENDGYFATAKSNTALLSQLNAAMLQIRLQDPYFNDKLDQKYYNLHTSTAISFTREELEFIQSSPAIPCVYVPDAPPFSYYDDATGSVNGIAVDICRVLTQKTGLTFSWQQPATANEAVAALHSGEALLLPAKYHDYNWARQQSVSLTDVYLSSQMVMLTSSQTEPPRIVAVYDQDFQGPLVASAISGDVQLRPYNTVLDCVEAVSHNEADATFINAAIASHLVNNPKYSRLTAAPLYGVSGDVSMAISDSADPRLLSVLNKGLRSISPTEINQIMLSRARLESTGALATFFYSHPVEILLTMCTVFLLLILVLGSLLYIRMQNAAVMRKTLYSDALTGYPNYEALVREAPGLIQGAGEPYALLYLDIHQFKVINDTFGYEIGDQVLLATSNILFQFLGQGERFVRLYADTFALLLRYRSPEALKARVEELSARLQDFPATGTHSVTPLFSGGVYPLPEGFTNLDQACDRANYAKDSIPNHFTNTFVFYDDVMRNRVLAEKELEGSTRSALENGEFLPYYQPKVNALTGKVVGAEALVRWNHPKKGMLSPMKFLPFYEKNGFIVKIDLFIFEQVCRDLQQWLRLGNESVPISVNFSRRHVRDTGLPAHLLEIAQKYGIPTSLLEIEITETEELESVESAVEFVNALKSHGFGVSIDDYGTGYSSISFLQQLPLDALKLDRLFITGAMESDKARDIMRYLVGAMQRNSITVVCEGVETQAQLDFVVGLDCRYIQGFFYSPALPLSEFEEYLIHHGMETTINKNIPPIIDFERRRWNSAGDFLNKSMPSWIVCCSVESNYPVLSISPNFLEGMGYSALEFESATGGKYVNWIHPDDLPYTPPDLAEPGAPDPVRQYRLRKMDGSYLWVREVCKSVLSGNGQLALLCVCTDISDLVSLRAERLRLMDTIPGGVGELLLTEEGPIIQQATNRFYQELGHTPAQIEALGNNLMHVLYPQDIQRASEQLHKLLRHDVSTCNCSFRVTFENGELHWVAFQGRAYPSADGLRVTTVIYNSDEEMKAQQANEIAHTKLKMALSLAQHAVFEYNLCKKTIDSLIGFEFYGIPQNLPLNAPELFFKDGFVHPDDAEHLRSVHHELAAGQAQASVEIRLRSSFTALDSPYLWVRVTLSTIFDADNRPVRVVGLVENINQQKHFESALLQETQFRKIFTESSLMAFEINLTQDTLQRISGTRGFRLEEVCQDMPRPLRYSAILPISIGALVAPEDRERFAQEMSIEGLLALHQMGISEHEWEYRRLTPEGEVLWNAAFVHLALDQLSGDLLCYIYHRDIHERKVLEQSLLQQASRDSLTGVLNRASAERLIQSYLTHNLAPNRVQALLMIDFDHFKALNDTYGHLTGDKCLVLMTRAVQDTLRADDIIARMGGDEFVVLLKNLPNERLAITLAKKLSALIASTSGELDVTEPISVSIGVAISPRHGTSFEELYRSADHAMYQAKKNEKDRVVLFDGEAVH